MTSEPSVFTRIIDGELPATFVAQTERLVAIENIEPLAPVHILVIPRTSQYHDVVELAAGDPVLLAEMIALAKSIAIERADGDFRLVFNTGAGVGQSIRHVHAHVLAGDLKEGSLAS